jgi:hypothetical protein
MRASSLLRTATRAVRSLSAAMDVPRVRMCTIGALLDRAVATRGNKEVFAAVAQQVAWDAKELQVCCVCGAAPRH